MFIDATDSQTPDRFAVGPDIWHGKNIWENDLVSRAGEHLL